MIDDKVGQASEGANPVDEIRKNRSAIFNVEAKASGRSDATKDRSDSLGFDPIGIALSGGGIRSATFSLGVVQAIALAPAQVQAQAAPPSAAPLAAGAAFTQSLLSRFDYLSTVSGGGYIGSFVASLFVPRRLRAPKDHDAAPTASDAIVAADDAVRSLCVDPPGRISTGSSGAAPSETHGFPLSWLRENGRYLSPTGAGDMAYAAALDLRNWVAIHYVVGTMLVALFAAMAFAHALVWPFVGQQAYAQIQVLFGVNVWYSPLLWVALAPLVACVLPVGLAFWFTYPSRSSGPKPWNMAVASIIAIDVLLLLLLFADVFFAPGVGLASGRRLILLSGVLVLTLSLCWYGVDLRTDAKAAVTAHPTGRPKCESPLEAREALSRQRVRTTRQLTTWLQVTLILFGLGIVETLGQTIYLAMLGEGARGTAFWSTSGLAAALAWVTKTITKLSSAPKEGSWTNRISLELVGGILGVLIFALIAVAWSCFVTWIVWDGASPTASGDSGSVGGVSFVLFIFSVGLAWVTGRFPGFINLSSLQSFYSARLTRAYLGASNGVRAAALSDADPARHTSAGGARLKNTLSAAEPAPGDDVELAEYWDAESKTPKSLAPLHLINVTLAKTVDPAEQLVQRDRKGQPLCVSPLGFAIDGVHNNFRQVGTDSQIQRNLSVGQWVGVSGAAASTGLGRQTSLGLSLLLGAANVRLGTWWQSNASGVATIDPGWRSRFRTQAYLLDEFTAKFYGLRRPWQYMTDGGHFENLGLYELLRPERKLRLVLAVDASADPRFEFADLANLIRLARIDHKVEVEVQRGFDDPRQKLPEIFGKVFGTPEDFRQQLKDERTNGKRNGHATQCGLLLKATHRDWELPCWIVLIKPRVLTDSPEDVKQYAVAHPEFPHESTADQFFDEGQWESYRKLGLSNAQHVLASAVREGLETLVQLKFT